jgi:hypothetical protein
MLSLGGTGFERNGHRVKSKAGTILPGITQEILAQVVGN